MPRDKLLRKIPQRIGDILVQEDWITPEALAEALEIQRRSTVKRVGEILRECGYVNEEQIARALAKQYDLKYFDLKEMADGWSLSRELYSFKCKHLRILPMRAPDGSLWLILSDVTEDEKMELTLDDPSRPIHFAITSSTPQTQTLDENPTDSEIEQLNAIPEPEFPARPEGDEESGETPCCLPQLNGSTVERIKKIVGVTRAQSGTEFARSGLLVLESESCFSLKFTQIVQDSHEDLPEGYMAGSSQTVGRTILVTCQLPESCQRKQPTEAGESRESGNGGDAEDRRVTGYSEFAWPEPWPPPDLADELDPLLKSLREIPSSLMHSELSLRWMGRDTRTRKALNELTIQTLGVSLGLAQIHNVSEFWDAILARYRCLEANRIVRGDWERWREVQSKPLEVLPGHVLAMCSLVLLESPKTLAPRIEIEVQEAPVFSTTLSRLPGEEPMNQARYKLVVTRPQQTS